MVKLKTLITKSKLAVFSAADDHGSTSKKPEKSIVKREASSTDDDEPIRSRAPKRSSVSASTFPSCLKMHARRANRRALFIWQAAPVSTEVKQLSEQVASIAKLVERKDKTDTTTVASEVGRVAQVLQAQMADLREQQRKEDAPAATKELFDVKLQLEKYKAKEEVVEQHRDVYENLRKAEVRTTHTTPVA